MDNPNKKYCSFKDHENIEAICFCQECKVYLCNECENFHSKLLKNHHINKLDKDINEIFTGLCKEENHNEKLVFFCKDIINYVVDYVYVK